MAASFCAPKLYDSPIPDLFTFVAQQYPQRDIVQVIREHLDAPTDSVRITWATFIQHAQNAAADIRGRWAVGLEDELVRNTAARPREPGAPPVVVGLLAANGYEYYVNMIGCSLNRWTLLLISPRNSPAAIEHLLRVSGSSLLLVDAGALEFGRTLAQSIPGLSAHAIASLDTPANGPASSPITPLSPAEVKMEMDSPAFYIHTSGSTGNPKIITWSHNFVLSGARTRARDGDAGVGVPFYSMPPLFHAMGMFAYCMFVLAHGNLITFVSSPTPKPPSADALVSHIPFIKGGIVSLPPSILEDLQSLGPEAVKTIAEGTSHIICAGAPLKAATGDALIAAGMKLAAAWGSTEVNVGCKLRPSLEWDYIEFREGYNWHFLPVDDHSNLRELIVGPGPEDCPAVIDHEDPRGFATNDIWVPHPSIPNLWKHHSRKGDITVLSNGEKTDNKQIENLLSGTHIRLVQVFGAGRPLNGVVLQPADPTVPVSDFLAQIQPTIEHANSILPKHSRLVSELIVVASQSKQFVTTDKGTIKAKENLDRFREEIEAGYIALEEGGAGSEWTFDGSVDDEENVRGFVRSAVKSVLGDDVPDDDDLFEHGLDSLLAMRLRAAVLAVTKKKSTASESIPRNVVYTYPTITALTTFLVPRESPGVRDTKQERILRSIARFSSDFIAHKPGSETGQGEVVALSGSTGSVGCSLLALLLERRDISKLYLLNRKGSETQKERQARGFKERGLDTMVLERNEHRITYLDIDLSRKDFGLSKKDYDDIRKQVTHIIHGAWHLNFNLILESYERVHIAGVRHFIDLALSSPRHQPPRLTFLSSVAAVRMYRSPPQSPVRESEGRALVPEEPIDDPSIPLDQGYGQSKYVSERVLVNAVKAGLRTTIVRVGQLAGTLKTGAWNPTEHIPIMLRSSIALGMIPDDLPAERVVPSDIAASAILKQIFASSSSLEYFHVENPHQTPWKSFARAVSEAAPKPLRFVSLGVWLEHIRKSNPDPEQVPAIRLLDFFAETDRTRDSLFAVLDWQKSVMVAPELAVRPSSNEQVRKYVEYQIKKSRGM